MRRIGIFTTACAIVLAGAGSSMAQSVLIGIPMMPVIEATTMNAAAAATPAYEASPAWSADTAAPRRGRAEYWSSDYAAQ